ncbi:collagen-binding domain-containing protein [Jatrophihabitans sp. DSM 45814]
MTLYSASRIVAAAAVAAVAMVGVAIWVPTEAQAAPLAPVNPVRLDLAGHPANSGFLVFVAGNVALNADESEGTIAAGGDLSFNSTYNVAAGSPPVFPTFTAPGDARPTYLYVGGGMAWTGNQILRVQNSGFTKIAGASTYTARNTDSNGASGNYHIVKPGAPYESMPRIEGTVNQPPASVSTPVPGSLIDVAGAFGLYRQLTVQLAGCPQTTQLTDPNGGTSPIPQPYASGARGRLTLTPGQTNFLQMSTQDLANLSEMTFTNQPTAQTPLVINVTGTAFSGNLPNLAGVSGAQAPYILWNFPQATSIAVNGGATIEGTIYAPNANLNWRPTQNVEGNIIANAFTHGPTLAQQTAPRELHDFPFNTTVSCTAPEPTGTLTLVKNVVNTGGGTATPSDFTLQAFGPQIVTGPGNSPAVTGVTVPTGDYALRESGGPPTVGYQPGLWSCTGGTLLDTTVHVTAGSTVTCTITNTFRAPPPTPTGTLTLVKQLDNTGGGLATPDQWTLAADGPTPFSGPGNTAQVTGVTVGTGDYTLSESGGTVDYVAGSWSCANGTLTGSTVTVTTGANVTCTITNTYTPAPSPPAGTITLVKQVNNTGGGTATATQWELTAAGPETITGASGTTEVTDVTVGTGDYTLTESGGPSAYAASNWACTGGALSGTTVTVTANSDVICTITNTFHPATATPSPPPSPGETAVAAPNPPASPPPSPGETETSSTLAATGTNPIPALLAATGLTALGALTMLGTHQRRRRSH